MHPPDRPIDPADRHCVEKPLTDAHFETVKAMYEEFVAMTQQGITGLYQTQEVRRAFYAGAFALFTGTMCFQNMPDEKCEQWMATWQDELHDFFKLIAEGKA